LVLKWLEIDKSLFTFTKKTKKREPKLVYGCRHLAEFTQHYKTGYFERPITQSCNITITQSCNKTITQPCNATIMQP
jgi:hypothetical protein